MKRLLNVLLCIFAVIGLVTVIGFIINPSNFGDFVGKFLIQHRNNPKYSNNIDVNVRKYTEQSGTFNLSKGENSFVLDLGEHEILVSEGTVSYTSFFYNPKFKTIFHPAKFVFADGDKIGEGGDYNCVKILKTSSDQENLDGCKIFTINEGLLNDTIEQYKLFVYLGVNTDEATVILK